MALFLSEIGGLNDLWLGNCTLITYVLLVSTSRIAYANSLVRPVRPFSSIRMFLFCSLVDF